MSSALLFEIHNILVRIAFKYMGRMDPFISIKMSVSYEYFSLGGINTLQLKIHLEKFSDFGSRN